MEIVLARKISLLLRSHTIKHQCHYHGCFNIVQCTFTYPSLLQLDQLLGIKGKQDDVDLEIMSLLIHAGAPLDVKNSQNETPLSLCIDTSTREFLKRYFVTGLKYPGVGRVGYRSLKIFYIAVSYNYRLKIQHALAALW